MVVAAQAVEITLQEFQRMLACEKGAQIVALETVTVPSYRKRGCPFKDNLLKYTRLTVVVNWQYSRTVNRQRVREGLPPNFEALPRQWGTRLTGLPFVSHVTKEGEHRLYLEALPLRVLEREFWTADTHEVIPTEEVRPYLVEHQPNARQGTRREILVRDYNVANIKSATMKHGQYVIT